MKLKTSRAPVRHLKRMALAACLIGSAAVANAQYAEGDTFSYFYGQTGSLTAAGGAGSYDFVEAAPTGFSSLNLLHNTGAIYDGGAGLGDGALGLATGPRSGAAANNRGSSIWSLGTGYGNNIGTVLDGDGNTLTEEITSVTLWFYVNSINDNAGGLPLTLGIYADPTDYSTGTSPGGKPNGALTGTFSVGATGWIGIDIPLSVAEAGFLISALPGDSSDTSSAGDLQVSIYSTHTNSGANFTPGFVVNTVLSIPEPSTVLLGGLGALVLLRRRRA